MFSMNKKIDTMFEFFLNQTFKKIDQLQKKSTNCLLELIQ